MAARTSSKKVNSKNNTRKKTSGRRGSPDKQPKKADISQIIGIVLFCLGILMFACQFIPSSGGFLNACRTFQYGLSGLLCTLLPLLVCGLGVLLVFFGDTSVSMKRIICGFVMFILIETFFQIRNYRNINASGYGSFLIESYMDSSRAMRGGGFLGALLAWPLYMALTDWGSYIVLFFTAIIDLVILTGYSFGNLGPSISEWADDFRENMALHKEERAAIREAKEEEKLNREAEEAIERSKRKQKEEKESFDDEMPPHFGTEEEKAAADKQAQPQQPDQMQKGSKGKKKKGAKSSAEMKPVEQPSPEPYPDDMPVTTNFKPIGGQRPVQSAPRIVSRPVKKQGNVSPTLYIERDDEFFRNPNSDDGRTDNGRGFTKEEAEHAFLYGVNAKDKAGNAAGGDGAGTGSISLGDPIPLHPEMQNQKETDPYERYRNKTYDTGIAVGYGDNEGETDIPSEAEPEQDVMDDSKPVTAEPAAPLQSHNAETPAGSYAGGTSGRPVPPVEPVMPKMPEKPVPPVPPYAADRQDGARPAPTATSVNTPASSAPVAPVNMPAPAAPSASPVNMPAPSAPVAPVNMPAPSVPVAPVNAQAPAVAAAAAAAVSAAAVSADVLYNAKEVLESSGDVKQIGASQPISDESGKTRNRRRRARAETPAVQATPSMQPASAASDVSTRQTSPAASVEPAVPVHQAAETAPAVSRAQEVRPSPAAAAVNPYTRPAPVDEPETETDYENPDERPFGIDLNRQHPDGELPASIPARGYGVQPQRETERQGQPDRVMQPVQQMAQPKEQTIVQLRENRLDGTPMVPLPRDEHDSKIEVYQEYVKPSYDLLEQSRSNEDPDQRAKDENGMKKLLATLESFGVQARGLTYTHGPAITRYEIQPAPGVKVSRIVNLVDDIALNMASTGVRIEAPIPGKAAVGIEVPNDSISMVTLRDVIDTPEMAKETSPTAVALGKGISGKPVIADMAKMPHVLIAGATGSGKSVCINTIINSIIFRASPDEVRLILIDPKVVELSVYNGIPHLLIPVVTDPKKASAALDWAVVEMEHRYKRFESMGVRDIKGYNAAIGPDEPRMYKIIVIIDELADLMMVAPGEVEESICRLAQLARAAGIHLVIATQRPSVNVITGVIKANIPSRIAFAVSSQIDSRTILDTGGAEKLLGKGDMLYAPQGAGKPTRVQGCFVSDAEVERIVKAVKSQHQAEYSDDVMDKINSATEAEKAQDAQDAPAAQDSQVDEMLAKAIDLAVESGQVSISMLQRRLRVGYARAGRLVDEMTLRGITAEAEGPTKPRQVLISREEWKRMQEEM